MTADEERSRGGSRIYRHERRERSFELATEPSERAEAVEAHVARHIGPVESVWHELVSDMIHLDVHVVPPNDERNAFTLFTTGMSVSVQVLVEDGFPGDADRGLRPHSASLRTSSTRLDTRLRAHSR